MFSMVIFWIKKKMKNIYDNELQVHRVMSENNLNPLKSIFYSSFSLGT